MNTMLLARRRMMMQSIGGSTGIGIFTVNSSGKKVTFSPGNLQATYLGNNRYSWGFAANQYDYVGNVQGNTSINNQVVGKKVDLFGWTKNGLYSDGIKQYGINTSINESDYGSESSDICCKWGDTINDGNNWFVLSINEWEYLFNTRSVNGGTGERKSYSLNITYGSVRGLVLYPDDYTGSVISGTVSTLPNGVVFLPYAGNREGNSVSFDETPFTYWSSSNERGKLYEADYVGYDEEYKELYFSRYYRFGGQSVRLVREI